MSGEKRVFPWTRPLVDDLIILYEGQSIVYMTKMKDYKNKVKRYNAVLSIKQELMEKYKVECRNLTDQDLIKKVHVIRTQFKKEVGLLKKIVSNGASADAYEPKLWCFDMLQFLNDCDPVRESQSNIELSGTQMYMDDGKSTIDDEDVVFEGTLEEMDGCGVNEFINNSPCSSQASASRACTPSTTKSKKKMQGSVTDLIQSAVQSLENCRKRPRIDEDEFDIFARTIATELRKVKDPAQIRMLKKEIFIKIINAQQE